MAASPSGGTMPTTSGTNIYQFLSKDNTRTNANHPLNRDDILKLKELINGDIKCNSLFDDTIITWKNIVDRTKSIVENFGTSHAETTTHSTGYVSGVPINDNVQTDIDILLKSLDINKNTNIDKRDHTTITGTKDKDYIIGSPTDDVDML
jgi:hypothetical protein